MSDKFNLKTIPNRYLHEISRNCIKHQKNQHDRITGILLGLTAGDRIGGPKQMALQLSRSLLKKQGFDLETIGNHYLDWWTKAGFDTGPIAETVFSQVQKGQSFLDAASKVHNRKRGMTAGCNPAHRSTPLAMCLHIHNDQLADYAKQEARLTHFHPIAGETSAVANLLCRFLILGYNWEDALTLIKRQVGADMTTSINRGLKGQSLQKDGYAPHVLEAALYFVDSSDNFDQMLERAIAFADSQNYCPVLAGSLGGARWGSKNIANHWFEDCSIIKSIKLTTNAFAHEWSDSV